MSDRRLPPLNLLRVFDAAGRHLSFKLAAEELHVTPSAVSHQIKTLEDHLGLLLFHRLNRALELNPGIGRIRGYLALCLFQADGDTTRAIPLAESEPLGFIRKTGLAIFHDARGDREGAQRHLDEMFRDYDDAASYQYAQVYAQWGETDLALTWLENAVEIHDAGVTLANLDLLLDPLRDEPRFQAVLEAAGHR